MFLHWYQTPLWEVKNLSHRFINKTKTTVERKILLHLLKLTRNGTLKIQRLATEAQIPTPITYEALKKLQREGLIIVANDTILTSLDGRVRIAIRVIKAGADFEKTCRYLGWLEFENLASMVLEANQFTTRRRFRFKWASRRWEIDVLGCNEPIIVCIDCKLWRRSLGASATRKAAEAQTLRTKNLATVLATLKEKIDLVQWQRAVLVPAILSLYPSPAKFYRRVPIVGILQLQNFLEELPAQTNTLTHFVANF